MRYARRLPRVLAPVGLEVSSLRSAIALSGISAILVLSLGSPLHAQGPETTPDFAGAGVLTDGRTVGVLTGLGALSEAFVVTPANPVTVNVVLDCVDVVPQEVAPFPAVPTATLYASGANILNAAERFLIKVEDRGLPTVSRVDRAGIVDPTTITPSTDHCGAADVASSAIVAGDFVFGNFGASLSFTPTPTWTPCGADSQVTCILAAPFQTPTPTPTPDCRLIEYARYNACKALIQNLELLGCSGPLSGNLAEACEALGEEIEERCAPSYLDPCHPPTPPPIPTPCENSVIACP